MLKPTPQHMLIMPQMSKGPVKDLSLGMEADLKSCV